MNPLDRTSMIKTNRNRDDPITTFPLSPFLLILFHLSLLPTREDKVLTRRNLYRHSKSCLSVVTLLSLSFSLSPSLPFHRSLTLLMTSVFSTMKPIVLIQVRVSTNTRTYIHTCRAELFRGVDFLLRELSLCIGHTTNSRFHPRARKRFTRKAQFKPP